MPEPFDRHISDRDRRQIFDEEYHRLYGVSPQSPTAISEPPNPGYQTPGSVKFRLGTESGHLCWDQGSASDFVKMFGVDAAPFLLAQVFAPMGLAQQPQQVQQIQQVQQPALPYTEEPYRALPMLAPAAFPVYNEAIALPPPAMTTIQAGSPEPKFKSLKIAGAKKFVKAHWPFLLFWYLALSISLGNPNSAVRGFLLGNPLLSNVVHVTDPFNVIKWAYVLKLPYFVPATPATPATPEKAKEPKK